MTAHRTLLPPIPEEERHPWIRDMVDKYDGVKHSAANSPATKTVEGYTQWKRDCADDKRTPPPNHLLDFGLPSWPRKCERCGSDCVYCGNYCVNASCPFSLEMNDFVYAVQANDLVEALSIGSMCFPGLSVDAFAEVVRTFIYLKEGEPASSWRDP